MLNSSSINPLIIVTVLFILGALFWSFQRSQAYGELGRLRWLQSAVLILPWVFFLLLLTAGIYLNLIGIIFLLVIGVGLYIYLGNQLRSAQQNTLFNKNLGQPLSQFETNPSENPEPDSPDNQSEEQVTPDFLPISEADLTEIKTIFGIDTFFTTETIPYQEGAIFKGNLRGEPETVHKILSDKLKDLFAEKYRLFLVENPDGKPVIIVLPSTNDPQPTTLAQKNLALVLLVATLATSLEAIGILLGFDLFSDFSRYSEVLPLSLALWVILVAHEIGHHVIAKRYNVRLSIPFFIPTWQLGSFGSITRFESLLPNRNALFDVALAGPAIGLIVSLGFLMVGLTLSHPGSAIQIPTQFFQGSILVGVFAKIILGNELQQSLIAINPLALVGWLGLVINGLNLLPAGQLDGGRIVQAIYGRKIARRTTIATLIVLGIVTLIKPNNPIPLYWAVLILFLQRDLERPSLNELTEPDDTRASWGLVLLFVMLTVLIPFSPGLASHLGIGG